MPTGEWIHIGIQQPIFIECLLCTRHFYTHLPLSITQQRQTFGYSSNLPIVYMGRENYACIALTPQSIKRSRLAIGISSSIVGFALILLWVLGKFVSSLWASALSSVKNVMLTRIDDIYISSSFNSLRS